MFQSLLPKKKKEEEELDQNSLLARAFGEKPKAETVRRRVATYKDPYADLRRKLLRISLTFVLPAIALLVIGFVTITTVLSNRQEDVIPTETITMTDIAIPANVKRSPGGESSYTTYFKNQAETLLPAYSVQITKTESYVAIGKTGRNLLDYYKVKLIDSKKWKLEKQIGLSTALITIYTRPLTNGQVEGVIMQLQARSYDELNKINNSDSNGTGFVLAKMLATKR